MTAPAAEVTPERTVSPRPGATLEALITAQAYGLGFDLVGLTRTGPAQTAAAFDTWLRAGHAGEMHYLERGAEKRRDSRLPVEDARSAVRTWAQKESRSARRCSSRRLRSSSS